MKIFHLSDLHIGKRVNGYSMLEDQKFILEQIISDIREESPQAVVIAGDVYDKSMPSEDAVSLLDDFLCKIASLDNAPQVFIIYGNHDSAERLSFGNRLIRRSGVHLSPVFSGKIEPAVLNDEYGEVAFIMLPFIKPSSVRNAYPEETVESYTDAVRVALKHVPRKENQRTVLIAHQYVTGAKTSDSEESIIGGIDGVDASAFDGFDYVALGHLHRPQEVPGRKNMRYCGTPLKYSRSEKDDEKGILVVELGGDKAVDCRVIPLKPLHDMREIKGTYNELTLRDNYQGTRTDDYIHAILTDENDVIGAIGSLRAIYPNLISLEYENLRTSGQAEIKALDRIEEKTDMEILADLYLWQNNQEMSEEQMDYSRRIFADDEEER